ncbi:MAG TPA: DUF808 domain-containing protein [Pseudomonadota bacterium]|nr:DUF808 domain-containing protein [Pseudomonadota bacterium]
MPASLLALLDDIASVLDDVSILAKVAAKKTVGVVGDDLALNAQQVAGVKADRELPVVWGVFKGSALNKAILVPAALAINAFIPWAVTPLLMAGGVFLCFEGFEKLAHKFLQSQAERAGKPAQRAAALPDPAIDLGTPEKQKIKGAVRTDFILSAEIIAITLGTVRASAFATQVIVLSGIAALMTVGVYGLVAGIVKLDDGGLYLSRVVGTGGAAGLQRALGRCILAVAPWFMKALSIAGTAAMFLVGGSLLTHGIGALHRGSERLAHAAMEWGGDFLAALTPLVVDGLTGLVAGAAALLGWTLVQRLRRARAGKALHERRQ